MPEIRITPDNPLPSADLEKDAAKAGVEADDTTHDDGDTSLPASESTHAGEGEVSEDRVEEGLTRLPPG